MAKEGTGESGRAGIIGKEQGQDRENAKGEVTRRRLGAADSRLGKRERQGAEEG